MQTIGVIGCGLMGYGMAKNLISKGYEVAVYDVNIDAVKRVVAERASGASSVSDIAKSSDVLILSLSSTDLVEKVLVDKSDGVLENLKHGSAILDMSTSDVKRTRRLEEAAVTADVSYFDCLVSGGPDGAISGTLTIMVGDSREMMGVLTEEDFNKLADKDGILAVDAMKAIQLDSSKTKIRPPETIKVFLELNIEQGSILEESGIRVGIVETIIGLIQLEGTCGHASTARMDRRSDALITAAKVLVQFPKVAKQIGDGTVIC